MKMSRLRHAVRAGIMAALLCTQLAAASDLPYDGSIDLNQIAEVMMNTDLSAQQDDSLEKDEEELKKLLDEIDLEAIAEAAVLAESVLESDEFRSLISYQEVKELGEVVADRIIDFVVEDPELTGKILITLGLKETTAGAAVDAIKLISSSGFDVRPVLKEVIRQVKNAAG